MEHGHAPRNTRPPLMRKDTSGSNRLSQLFESRPSSVSSISPSRTTAASRRTSYPSPLLPSAGPRRTSWVPTAPPPPPFTGNTAYEPSASLDESQGTSALMQSRTGTKKLLSRLASFRGVSSRNGSYNRIEDEESALDRHRLRGVQEDDESTGPSYNSSDTMSMTPLNPIKLAHSAVDTPEQPTDLNEAGYAAEFERLEAKAQLGSGMSSITERPFTHNPSAIGVGSYSRQPRGIPHADVTISQARNAQEEAEKTGGIVAVAGIPVDISESFSGGDFETRSMMTSCTHADKDEAQKSYFFPQGSSKSGVDFRKLLTCHRSGHAILASPDHGLAVACNSCVHRHSASCPPGSSLSNVSKKRARRARTCRV
jgi:hypothetical protein